MLSVPPTHENVLGVLSLIIYALLLVISVKYVVIVMRADNDGEGGILALTARVPGRKGESPASKARLAHGRARHRILPAAARKSGGTRRAGGDVTC